MNIIIKYPETEEGMMILYEKLAKARVQLIKDYILDLPISLQSKATLFEKFKEEVRKMAEEEIEE